MPKISVIIPAYNSEKFIAETLDCLVEQTLDDIEAIVVDDGSSDSTGEIVKEYCERHPFIKYFRQENAGVSAARNEGIKLATGEYTVFLDADDVYTKESLEGFYTAAKESGADLVIGRLRSFGAGVSEYNEFADKLSKKKTIDTYDLDLLWNFLVGNKCYNTQKLKTSGVVFPPLTYSEEGVFFTKFVYTGAKIAGTENSTMCYRRHTKEEGLSVSQSVSISLVKNFIASLTAIYESAKQSFENPGGCKDEGAYLQEIIYKTAHILIFQFYRHFWRVDDECLAYIKEQMDRLASMMDDRTKKRLADFNSDICVFPINVSKKDVAENAKISVILKDFDSKSTLESVYESSYPFFEVFASADSRKYAGDDVLKCENFHVLESKGFLKTAKKRARGEYVLVFSKPQKVDDRIFRFLVRFEKIPRPIKKLFFQPLYFLVNKKIT
ncbi:MAG: glycosyltransferase family 2 protein [Clostridia bacterium]|nr:glycosyltransferase family 2 protein [Clostridia bacterium]